jgi:hypothetical protein
MTPRRTALIACLTTAFAVAIAAPVAQASHSMDSTFQDDNHLVFAAPAEVNHTLDILKSLGVKRIRVSVFWKSVAPSPTSTTKPSFNAADPAEYPPGAWDHYDTVVKLARAHHIKVNFDPTSPAPSWATDTPPSDRPDIRDTFDPHAQEFGLFMVALGRRYSGTYKPPGSNEALPRVNYWSIWNEPNQGGWLTPQWAKDPRSATGLVEASPSLYRSLVDVAWTALQGTGHAKDTFLIGETAPKGGKNKTGVTTPMDALRFIRELYCVDKNLQVYQGTSAQLRGCPVDGSTAKFVSAHPGLFQGSGWAHHPYELTFSPKTKPSGKDWATIANLPTLSRLLRKIHQRYGQPTGPGGNVPLYLTEFGYQTNPPDPLAVSPAKQAAWINESEYIAYSNRSVRTLAQFLLYDDNPVPGIPRTSPSAWSTFQSGLINLDGSHKLAFDAYRFPLYLPHSKATRKGRLRVWGILRVAGGGAARTVRVEAKYKGSKKYKRVGLLKTDKNRGYIDGHVTVKKSGTIRMVWKSGGTTYRSRTSRYTVPRKKR